MGLIGYYIFFALKGGTTYGFSPLDFIQRPALWLETITKYTATASSAPNFAFDYCLLNEKIPSQSLEKLNLNSLKFLMTAAEPINTKVYTAFLNKFKPYGLKPKSFFAAYGLAEFTLAVTNYGRNFFAFEAELLKNNIAKIADISNPNIQSISLMSCGKPLGDTKILIVDISANPTELSNGKIGEIWLNGSSKCAGYWNKSQLTNDYFEAQLNTSLTKEKWLRTGDLGFIFKDELYISGRLKDLIIMRGLNFYPQDIEALVESDSMVRKGSVAAFSIEKNGSESLVVVIGLKNKKNIPNAHTLNNQIIKYLGIGASTFVFIAARSISKTSSGKIMRYQNKYRYLQNKLDSIQLTHFEQFVGINSESVENTSLDLDSPKFKNLNAIFKYYNLTGNESETLGDAGIDSIKLVEFTHDIKEFLDNKGYQDLSSELDLRLVQKIAISELFEILKGIDKTEIEWGLLCIAHNLKKIAA